MSSKARGVRTLRAGLVAVAVFATVPGFAAQCAQKAPLSTAVQVTSEEAPNCDEFILLGAGDYENLRNPFSADPDFSTVLWAWGATLVLWAIGLGIGSLYRLTRARL